MSNKPSGRDLFAREAEKSETYTTKFFIILFLIIILIIVLAVHGNWKPEVSALIGAFSSVIFTRLWKSIYKKKAHKK